jgi:hypothetical protein
MLFSNLDQMMKGWFVGDFVPSLYSTKNVEVGVKKYNAGDKELTHFHKVATEITVIISGKVRMNDKILNEGEIIVIDPYESTDFEALADTVTVVVKLPGVLNDKYLGAL